MLVGSSGTGGREADLPRSTTGTRGSQTLLNHPGSSRADSESVWGQQPLTTGSRTASDKVSDNRHGQRGTAVDAHGRSAAGHGCWGAGSPRLSLASGRRGQRP